VQQEPQTLTTLHCAQMDFILLEVALIACNAAMVITKTHHQLLVNLAQLVSFAVTLRALFPENALIHHNAQVEIPMTHFAHLDST
jgi:hypothetical protein